MLDVPHLWTGWARRTLIGADEILIVAAPDLANLRNTKNLIDLLRAARPNDHRPHYCLNQVGMPKRPEIKPADFAKALEDEPIAIIPFEPQLFGTAANNGQMIAEVSSEPSRRRDVPLAGAAADRPRRGEARAVEPAHPAHREAAEAVRRRLPRRTVVFGKRSTYGPAMPAQRGAAHRAGARRRPPAARARGARAAVAEAGRTPLPSAGLRRADHLAAARARRGAAEPPRSVPPRAVDSRRSESYYEVKGTIFGALIEAIDLVAARPARRRNRRARRSATSSTRSSRSRTS